MSIEKVTCFVTRRICVKGYDVTLRSEISFTIYPDLVFCPANKFA